MQRSFPRLRSARDRLLGIVLLLLAWQAIHLAWGPFVLPSPLATLAALAAFVTEAEARTALVRTAVAALGGFAAGSALGLVLGAVAGRSERVHDLLNPTVVTILAVPPIAWVVLALLWFGASGWGAGLTAALALMPLVFAATVQGMRTLDAGLETMAAAFGAGPWTRLVAVRLPQVASHVVPALATAHGIAWKAVVMAEVLGAGAGLGAELATARAHLDLPRALAMVAIVVVVVLAVDAWVLDPLRRRVEAWREDRPPPGVPPC